MPGRHRLFLPRSCGGSPTLFRRSPLAEINDGVA